jgi:hypothetical protein
MKAKLSLCVAAGIWFALAGSPASASNVGFLHDSPYFTHFKEEDRKMFRDELTQLLDHGKPGDERAWFNSATGAKGTIRFLRSGVGRSVCCHEVYVENRARGRIGQGQNIFCKDADGVWQLKPQGE